VIIIQASFAKLHRKNCPAHTNGPRTASRGGGRRKRRVKVPPSQPRKMWCFAVCVITIYITATLPSNVFYYIDYDYLIRYVYIVVSRKGPKRGQKFSYSIIKSYLFFTD
jgi:hypothetical protein